MKTLLYKITDGPGNICVSTSCILYPVLNCFKLFSLVYPLRARNLRYRDGYKIVAVIWSYTTLIYSAHWIVDGQTFYVVTTKMAVIGVSLLLLLTIVSTIALLLTVHKARGLGRKGVISISLVSAVYCVCYTPMGVNTFFQSIYDIGKQLPFRVQVGIISFYYTSCFSNPIVYYFTLRSFKEYTDMMFRRCFTRTSAASARSGNLETK